VLGGSAEIPGDRVAYLPVEKEIALDAEPRHGSPIQTIHRRPPTDLEVAVIGPARSAPRIFEPIVVVASEGDCPRFGACCVRRDAAACRQDVSVMLAPEPGLARSEVDTVGRFLPR
jgi:hypothetical protein